MLIVSNALLMCSATAIVHSGGLFRLKPVAMVLFMLCNDVLVEWLRLNPCCVEMCGILVVMYDSSVFSSALDITERTEMGLYGVPMFMSLLGFGIGMIFASFHMYGIMLFCDMLYMLVRYASSSCPICLRSLMLTFSPFNVSSLFSLFILCVFSLFILCAFSLLILCFFLLYIEAISDLVICRISKQAGTVKGGDEIFMLCEKVQKGLVSIQTYKY